MPERNARTPFERLLLGEITSREYAEIIREQTRNAPIFGIASPKSVAEGRSEGTVIDLTKDGNFVTRWPE